nr:hypothetical protein F56C9.4 - Caenorhabditis elegans [Caenorhabditis elegans]
MRTPNLRTPLKDFPCKFNYLVFRKIKIEKQFNFFQEIIAGMLDLPPKKWRKRETDEMSKQKSRAENFKKLWEPVDWTKRLKNDSTK